MNRKCVVIHSREDYSCNETPFPPIGTIGYILTDIDECQEYDVLFPSYPCPTVNDPTWVTHKSMISIIDEDKMIGKTNERIRIFKLA